MDRIAEWFFSMNNGLFDSLARAINEPLIFLAIILMGLLLLEPKNDRRLKIICALAMATILGLGLKETYRIQRPCALETSKVMCPSEYSFPSIHCAVVFTLMIAFLGKPAYPVVLIGALIVAISRMYLGVHTFEDVVGGLIIAPFAYYAVQAGWRLYGKRD